MAKSDQVVAEVRQLMGDQLISNIYRDRIRTIRTRRFELNAPVKNVVVEVMHTLLGIELKVGKRRISCPDLATARYLAVFARLGLAEVAVPYDITQISRLADDLESGWFRMLMLVEHVASVYGGRLPGRVRSRLISQEREELRALGAGPAIPQFNQNTRQRRPKP